MDTDSCVAGGGLIAEEFVEILEEADDDDGGRTCQSHKEEEGEHIGGNSDDRVHGLIVSRDGGEGGIGAAGNWASV